MRSLNFVALAVMCGLGAPAGARDDPARPRAPILDRVVDCRAVQTAAERLACYDREVAALDAAEAAREVLVYDREQVRKTRRTLFGIPLPDQDIFGGNGGAEQVVQIDGVVRAVAQDASGRYAITIEDGARWIQIDDRELSAVPRPGQKIIIRRAAMGSYLANIGTNVAIRVRRVLPGS